MIHKQKLVSQNHQQPNLYFQLFFLLILISPALLIVMMPLNNDIWFLLNSGRYVFSEGIPTVDPFTMHDGFDFVMQQWASACVFWITYKTFGIVGLKILVFIFSTIIVMMLHFLCMKVSDNNFIISFFVTLPASFLTSWMITARPGMFSILLLLCELVLLEYFSFDNKVKYLIPLPFLSAFLINFHAAMWLMSFVFILPYLVESIPFKAGKFKNTGGGSRQLAIATILMFALGFANPYGLKAITYLFRSYGYSSINRIVGEMHPTTINTILGLFVYGSMLLLIIGYCFYRQGRIKVRYFLLTVGTAYLALSAMRSISLFAIGGFFPLAYYLKDIKPSEASSENNTPKVLIFRKTIMGLMIVALGSLFFYSIIEFPQYDSKTIFLKETIQQIQNEDSKEPVVLYTGYDAGDLAEFMGLSPYLDTRAEVFIKKNNGKEDILDEYCALETGGIYYKDFLRKYDFTHLIVTKNDILFFNLLHDADYHIAYCNDEYYLFEKTGTGSR